MRVSKRDRLMIAGGVGAAALVVLVAVLGGKAEGEPTSNLKHPERVTQEPTTSSTSRTQTMGPSGHLEDVVPGGDDDPKMRWVDSTACYGEMENQIKKMISEPGYVTGNKTNGKSDNPMPKECYDLPEDQLLSVGQDLMTSYIYTLNKKPALDKWAGMSVTRESWVW